MPRASASSIKAMAMRWASASIGRPPHLRMPPKLKTRIFLPISPFAKRSKMTGTTLASSIP